MSDVVKMDKKHGKGIDRLRVKGPKIHCANAKHKKAGVAMLMFKQSRFQYKEYNQI